MKAFLMVQLFIVLFAMALTSNANAARLKDVANIRGVRSNQLVGYGLVIGLNGTGDSNVVYSGAGTDNIPVTTAVFTNPLNTGFSASFPLESVYQRADYNLDGDVIYSGAGTEIQQITISVFSNPVNTGFSASVPVVEQCIVYVAIHCTAKTLSYFQ